MRKFLIPLVLLGSAAGVAIAQPLPNDIQLGPEIQLPTARMGGVQETLAALVRGPGGGYTVYANSYDTNALTATAISADGTPNLASRRRVAPRSAVAPAGDHLVAAWLENGWVVTARIDGTQSPFRTTRVAQAVAVDAVGCGGDRCAIAAMVWSGESQRVSEILIETSLDGDPVGAPMAFPCTGCYFRGSIELVTVDPTGYILSGRPGHTVLGIPIPPFAFRLDRAGNELAQIRFPLCARLYITWTGTADTAIYDELLYGGPPRPGSITAADISATSTLVGPRKLLERTQPFSIDTTDGDFLFSYVEAGRVIQSKLDTSFTTATAVGSFAFPDGFTFVTATRGFAIAMKPAYAGALYAVPANGRGPLLISYGPLPQQVESAVAVDGEFLVAWTETDMLAAQQTLRFARLRRDGTISAARDLGRAQSFSLRFTAAGSDALIVWRDSNTYGPPHAAIIRSDDTILPLDLGIGFPVTAVAGRANDWVLFAQNTQTSSSDEWGKGWLVVVSRNGLVSPARQIESYMRAAASDGEHVLGLAVVAYLFGPALDFERRNVLLVLDDVVFSDGWYLAVDSNDLVLFDDRGFVRATLLFPQGHPPMIAAAAHGWILANSSKFVFVLADYPLTIAREVKFEGIMAIAGNGSNHMAIVASHDVDELDVTARGLFIRTLDILSPPPRRRAVMTR